MNLLLMIFKEVVYLGAVSSLLILVILLIKKVFNKALSPKWHYYIWILLLIRLLIPYYPESSMSIYNLFYNAAEKIDMSSNNIPVVLPQATSSIDKQSSLSGSTDKTTAPNKETQNYFSLLSITAVIWLTGTTLLGLYVLYMNISFTLKIRKNYTPLKDERINNILEYCKTTMGIKQTIPLLYSEENKAPSLFGLKATILVSKPSMEKLSEAELKYIFLHELSHYKRKDIIVNWILVLLQIVYFFNPLIWYAFRKIHEDCEVACDASALRYINNTEYQSYGYTIIKLLKLISESDFIAVTAGISKNKSSYKRRILLIGEFRKSKWTGTLLSLVLITFVGLVGLTSFKPSAKTNLYLNNDVIPNSSMNNLDFMEKNKEVYFGEWVIKKVLAYGSVGTYSIADAEGLIGKTLFFSAEKASYFGDSPLYISNTAHNPVYEKTMVSKHDFMINNHLSFEVIGIKSDSVQHITVSNPNGYISTFLVKDDDTLIIFGGGTYFELDRIK